MSVPEPSGGFVAFTNSTEPSMSDPGDLPVRLDAAAIQRSLAIGARQLYAMIAAGHFPPPDLRVGRNRRRLWNLATVLAWQAQQQGTAARNHSLPA